MKCVCGIDRNITDPLIARHLPARCIHLGIRHLIVTRAPAAGMGHNHPTAQGLSRADDLLGKAIARGSHLFIGRSAEIERAQHRRNRLEPVAVRPVQQGGREAIRPGQAQLSRSIALRRRTVERRHQTLAHRAGRVQRIERLGKLRRVFLRYRYLAPALRGREIMGRWPRIHAGRGGNDKQAEHRPAGLLNVLNGCLVIGRHVIKRTKLTQHSRRIDIDRRRSGRSRLHDSCRFGRSRNLISESEQSSPEHGCATQRHENRLGSRHIRRGKGSSTHQAIIAGAFGTHDVAARRPHIHLRAVVAERAML